MKSKVNKPFLNRMKRERKYAEKLKMKAMATPASYVSCPNCGVTYFKRGNRDSRCEKCMDTAVRAAKVNAAAVKRRKEKSK